MLERTYGEISFICDVCLDELETETKAFDQALKIFHEANWQSRQLTSEVAHICPDCLNSEVKNALALA